MFEKKVRNIYLYELVVFLAFNEKEINYMNVKWRNIDLPLILLKVLLKNILLEF